MTSGYTTRDAARVLGLTEAQVRSFAQDGFLTPQRRQGEYRFSFQDLVLLRAAKGLAAARIPTRRIRAALKRLKQELPAGRALSELRIVAEGDRIVATDGQSAWNPESGQLQLDFSVAELASKTGPIARRRAQAAREQESDLDAAQWYALGFDLEVSAPEEARDAYRRALELDPHHADAHVNLGRLLHEAGRVTDAAEHYRLALAASPRHATAAFDLGIALEDLGRVGDAIRAYQNAIQADPRLADAHFNLFRLYEQSGKKAAALRHLSKYHRLTVAE